MNMLYADHVLSHGTEAHEEKTPALQDSAMSTEAVKRGKFGVTLKNFCFPFGQLTSHISLLLLVKISCPSKVRWFNFHKKKYYVSRIVYNNIL